MFQSDKNRVENLPTSAVSSSSSTLASPRRRSIVREFALNTSTHGLPGMARSRSKSNLAFWTVSFLIFLGVAIYFIVQSVRNFFQYPTQTSVSIVLDETAAFPAVSICNYAPIRFDRVAAPFLNYTNARNLTNTNDTTQFTAGQAMLLHDFLIDSVNANASLAEYYFPLNITLMECKFNNKNCTASDFRPFLSSAHGLCHTFNPALKDPNSAPPRKIYDNGGDGKLQLRLYANSHLYVPDVSQG